MTVARIEYNATAERMTERVVARAGGACGDACIVIGSTHRVRIESVPRCRMHDR